MPQRIEIVSPASREARLARQLTDEGVDAGLADALVAAATHEADLMPGLDEGRQRYASHLVRSRPKWKRIEVTAKRLLAALKRLDQDEVVSLETGLDYLYEVERGQARDSDLESGRAFLKRLIAVGECELTRKRDKKRGPQPELLPKIIGAAVVEVLRAHGKRVTSYQDGGLFAKVLPVVLDGLGLRPPDEISHIIRRSLKRADHLVDRRRTLEASVSRLRSKETEELEAFKRELLRGHDEGPADEGPA